MIFTFSILSSQPTGPYNFFVQVNGKHFSIKLNGKQYLDQSAQVELLIAYLEKTYNKTKNKLTTDITTQGNRYFQAELV